MIIVTQVHQGIVFSQWLYKNTDKQKAQDKFLSVARNWYDSELSLYRINAGLECGYITDYNLLPTSGSVNIKYIEEEE